MRLNSARKYLWGNRQLRSLFVDDIRKMRKRWTLSPGTIAEQLELARAFFSFCMDSGWIDKNPAEAVRAPQSKAIPNRGDYGQRQKDEIEHRRGGGMRGFLKSILALVSPAIPISGGCLMAQGAPVKNVVLVHEAFTNGTWWQPKTGQSIRIRNA
jgi:hypothetical protein